MFAFDIIVHPSFSEPQITTEARATISRALWNFSERTNMLAEPKHIVPKYIPPPAESFKVFGPVEPGIAFRSDHLARPCVRKLYENRAAFKTRGPKYVETINKTLDKCWDSIYNYYRKKLRERHLKRLIRKQQLDLAKKPTSAALEKIEIERQQHLAQMATPRKLFLPPKIIRKCKPLEDLLATLETLAAPRSYTVAEPRELGKVRSAALVYEITDNIRRLAQVPQRMRFGDAKPVTWTVKPGALRAKCTERIEKLAQPSFSAREAKKHDEDKYDPWIIPPNALKYKASARILELAKPLERE